MPVTINYDEVVPGRRFYLELDNGENDFGTILPDKAFAQFDNPRWARHWKWSVVEVYPNHYTKFYWVDKLTLDDYIRNIVIYEAAITEEFKQVLTAALERT